MKRTFSRLAFALLLVVCLAAFASCLGGGADETTAKPATTAAPSTTAEPATTGTAPATAGPATTGAASATAEPTTTGAPTTTAEPATTSEPACDHVWDEGVKTADATCSKEGEILYTCSICGATRTEAIEKLPHQYTTRVISAPTCTQTGMKLLTCSVCKDRDTVVIPIDPDAHSFRPGDEGRIVTPPTETKEGELEKICSTCGQGVRYPTAYDDYNTKVTALKAQVDAFQTSAFGGSVTSNLGSTYSAPSVSPQAQHPRVMFNQSNLDDIRSTIYDSRNSTAVKLFLNVLAKPTDGKRPASSDHNNFSSDVLDQIQALALDYALTGNKITGYQAILALKNHLTTMDFAGIESNAERQYGLTMFVSACVYDWCYDLLTSTDKTQIVAGVEHQCCDGDKMEMGFPPSKQYSVAGHGCEFQLLRDYLAFAIAIYDDYPGWWNYIGGRFYAEFVEPRNYYYAAGMVTQGASLYIRIRFSSDLYSALLIQAATGTMPYDAEGMKQVMRTVYSYELPGRNAFASGDNNVNDGEFIEYSRNTLLSSYLFDDATMRANLEYYKKSYSDFTSYYTVGSNYAEYLICSSNGVVKAKDRHEDMPLIRYNGGWLGQIIARNNWDNDQAAILMKIGVRTGGNHDHRDAGQFQIWYKTMLAGDTGDYDSYGSQHWSKYHQETVAHNCILIGGTGQVRRGGNERSHRNYLSDTQNAVLTGVAYGYADADETQPTYAYVAGDLSLAYNNVASAAERRMLAVYDTKNDDVPLYFFVYDNITSNSSVKKTFLLHVPADPTISGNTVTVASDGGKLVLQNIVGGDAITKIGGEGHNYEVNGTQYDAGDDGFWGRAEISTAGSAKTEQLLNVMYVCDEGKNPAGQTASAVTGTATTGAVIGKVAAVFVTASERRTTGFNFTASGDGELTYYVSGVKAGTWTVVAGVNIQTVTATEDGGLLVFTAPAGKITLMAPKS